MLLLLRVDIVGKQIKHIVSELCGRTFDVDILFLGVYIC